MISACKAIKKQKPYTNKRTARTKKEMYLFHFRAYQISWYTSDSLGKTDEFWNQIKIIIRAIRTQWAAVTITLGDKMDPPHKWLPSNCKLTCHGHWPPSLATPPTIRRLRRAFDVGRSVLLNFLPQERLCGVFETPVYKEKFNLLCKIYNSLYYKENKRISFPFHLDIFSLYGTFYSCINVDLEC